jgi:hypothetical protein
MLANLAYRISYLIKNSVFYSFTKIHGGVEKRHYIARSSSWLQQHHQKSIRRS